MSVATLQPRSAWPHLVSVALACATFPLIWVGGLVTTYDAGMAVPDWPTTYGYNMFSYPLSTWISGPWDLFIEHGHRLLGSLAGLLTIVLNVVIWRFDSRRWLRWVALAALALVILQGVLGGMRVRLGSTQLARIHGCTGPLFFAFSIAICVMTSRFWFRNAQGDAEWSEAKSPLSAQPAIVSASIAAAAWFTLLVAYTQLVLGAHLRHPGINWGPAHFRALAVMHIVIAFFLVLQVIGVAKSSRKLPTSLRQPALLLACLVLAQVGLGIATWRAKYGWPTFIPVPSTWTLASFTVEAESMGQALTVTAHVALGSLILAVSTWYATRVSRYRMLVAKADRHRASSTSERLTSSRTRAPLPQGAVS